MLSPHPSSVGSKPSKVRLRDSEGSARLHHLDFFRSLSSPCLLTDPFRYSRRSTSHRTVLPSRFDSISQVPYSWPLGISVPRRRPSPRMQRAKGTQEDDLSLAEETVKITSQSHDEINNAEKAALDPSSLDEHDLLTDKGSSVRNVVLWVCAAVTFGIALGLKDGIGKASEYFAGYLLEQSLSVDNLFVFVLIFKYFKVPKMYQSRVLSFGIAGAIIFRAIVILLGTVTLQRFEVVTLLLALILLYSSYKLFFAEEEENDLADNFIVKTCQRFIPVTAYYDGDRFLTSQDGSWKATPLLLTVAIIELSDIAFAIDSIPAVFGVTRDPFIVFSSNLFAISGLRSLYILISESMSDLQYLQPAIAVVLGFIGMKMILDFFGRYFFKEPAIAVVLGFIGTKMILDFFGYHITTEVSLGFVATSLSAGVLLSLVGKSDSESKEGK